jgi:hypothetical protein
MPSITGTRDPQHECARRIKRGDRTVVLPPAGYGQIWVGGTRHTSTARKG